MAKKKSKNYAPNAPDLQTILLESPIGQQPSQNQQYYPDLAQASPPPYTDLSTEASRMNNPHDNNPRYQRLVTVTPGHPTVIVQRPAAPTGRDFIYVRYIEKVRSFNRGLILNSLLGILASIIIVSLYSERTCVWNYVIHQPSPDHPIRISDLRDQSFSVIGLSIILLFVSLVKSAIGYGKSSGCFLFIVAILTFIGLLQACYMTYLSLYSPCVVTFNELVGKGAKDIASGIASLFKEKMPEPTRGVFGETTVFDYVQEDKYGVAIFAINAILAIGYLSNFISAITTC